MKISTLFSEQKRNKHYSMLIKRVKNIINKPKESIPVFIFGKQRSGTTMLMNVFHLHPDIEVFDERRKSKAFFKFRIRDFRIIQNLVNKSRFEFICFKPVVDSHLIKNFISHFPDGKFIWMYRDYKDNANSAIRKFPHATLAIKQICRNEESNHWIQEGITQNTATILRDIYSDQFSEFDFACLIWWIRNRIVIEQNLVTIPNLKIIKYEDIVSNSNEDFNKLFHFIGMKTYNKVYSFVHTKSISKNSYPNLSTSVENLCDDLYEKLNGLIIEKE